MADNVDLSANRTFNINAYRNNGQQDEVRQGSILSKEDPSLTPVDLESMPANERNEWSSPGYENSVWATVVDIRMCKDFVAIKHTNGQKILHKRDAVEGTAIYGLFKNLLKLYQPEESVTARVFSTSWNGGRWRGQIYHCSSGWMIALRQMPYKRPNLSRLGFEMPSLMSLSRGSGLVLFAGPTGAGKSTSLAGLVYALQKEGQLGDTVTIEDPIEFLYDDPFIQQREVGVDVTSFHDGIHEAMRQSPDTIVIGEIRHHKTAEIAVQAGLTGHRVMATIHAESVEEACSRMFALLDDHHDELLPQAIQGIVAQHLIRNEQGRVLPVYETLKFDRPARSVLANGPDALNRLIHEQKRQSRHTLKESAKKWLASGMVTRESVARWVDDE